MNKPKEKLNQAKWGRPSMVWGAGQERRLNLVRRYVALEKQRILDVGCGLGLYLRRFSDFSSEVYGVDIDARKIGQIQSEFKKVALAPAEKLPFPESFFDLVFFNEVLEHVKDDRQAIGEAWRVLRAGGRLVIFAPNRFFPFETHGIYWRGKYHFGNFLLVNYLPNFLRNRFSPPARVYTPKGLMRLFRGKSYRILVFSQIYPGFDKIELRQPGWAAVLRKIFYFLEQTPLKIFGLSHLLILEKR